jgi:TetR/AcrR family transcriptional regulator, transcriptional repressor for nem operon
MRYGQDHKIKTRAKVLREAAKVIRRDGPANVGVADVMSKAGLTHGGFYAHFKSREELIAEGISEAFKDSLSLFDRAREGRDARQALAYYIRAYLSVPHRDSRDTGCPVAALSSDVPRLEGPARERFFAGMRATTARLRALMMDAGIEDADEFVLPVRAELIGALSLARVISDPDWSGEVLFQSRRSLLKRLGLSDLRSSAPHTDDGASDV